LLSVPGGRYRGDSKSPMTREWCGSTGFTMQVPCFMGLIN